jgi:hypothetical protein
MHTKFWSENLKGRDNSEDLDVDRVRRCVDQLHLAQNRDQWLATVMAVMNLWVP